jgi:peptidoglycan/xylan/chitin deacetylase (PgdA/CDA1 family)
MARGTLIVRRRDIETDPRPVGGAFADVRMVPFSVPGPLARPLGVFCLNTADPVCVLTYDDGPHPEHTDGILDALAEHGATATFFILTREARRHPDVVRRIAAEGHDVALHGADHTSLLTMGTLQAARTLRTAKRELERIAGTRVRLYRPPYGQNTMAQGIALALVGLHPVQWSGDAFDWVDDDPAAVADRARAALFPGCVMLLHDNRGDPETLLPDQRLPAFDRAEVTRDLLARMDRDGLSSISLSEALRRYQPVRSMARQRMSDA